MASSTPGSVSMMILRGPVTCGSVRPHRRARSGRAEHAPPGGCFDPARPCDDVIGASPARAQARALRSAVAGDLVQRDARGDASVQRLDGAADRDACEVRAAVSYTHLRAHETDSYLVCRLLLEKK